MPRIFDCFLFHNELDILQCRVEELYDVVHRFVVVECGETHRGAPKKSVYLGAIDRFRPWSNKIQYVWVPRLFQGNPKEREHEHRERIRDGVQLAGAKPDDIVIQSDADEIPTAAAVLKIESALAELPQVALDQAPHYFAVDWKHPRRCDMAPAAQYLRNIRSFWDMRHASAFCPCIPDAGWHFSWLGQPAMHLTKIASIYEGGEIAPFAVPSVMTRKNWRTGIHLDGVQMAAVDIDENFPKYIRERRCPVDWFRPRP